MKVLSLFDGMSCGQLALQKAGIKVTAYYASEIDSYCMRVTQRNFPNTVQLGDVTKIKASVLPKIDLLIGGSPCQGFSMSGKQLNFEDKRSKLFFEYVRILAELKKHNPFITFLLENVNMKKVWRDIISQYLGMEPILINSSLLSAQNRQRLYWTNIKNVKQPKDKNVLFKDIIENNVSNNFYVSALQLKHLNLGDLTKAGGISITKEGKESIKAPCIMSRDYKGFHQRELLPVAIDVAGLRRLTPIEYERLQTVPDNYTASVSNSQRYKMLGNGWTVDIIAHIFSHLKR